VDRECSEAGRRGGSVNADFNSLTIFISID
jgi:hypothetical protein